MAPGNDPPADEGALIDRLQAGDPDAFRDAIARYSPQMLATARAIAGPANAEDIVQDAWVAVLTRIDGFEGRARLATWLHRIVTNRAISHLRAGKREVANHSNADDEDGEPDADWFDAHGRWAVTPAGWDLDTPEALLSASALQECIDKHLELMPENQRLVVTLRDMLQQDFETICNALELSASNARVLLHRGRLRLAKMVDGFQETGTC